MYPCHQFVGQEEFLLGNVEEGITKPEIPEEFRGCSVYSKDSCRNCFARFYCSGGCMANSYKFHHTINDTYEVSCE
ncbi:SPASM domain-containing protein, partial [Erysipelatoclostridium ramosum]|uniref:SPASM domain-containing protein n=1 Tax=Thomasclavelia ramosa TaxID=1547 RepID=UPI001D00A822|nr:SPASM domain-containing protein [Thomasclavelia ramosa]